MAWFFGNKKDNEKQTSTRNSNEGTRVKDNKTITFKMVKPSEVKHDVKEEKNNTENNESVLIDLGSFSDNKKR